jgi:hypothetical protein
MNEQLQAALTEVLKATTNTAGQAKDFLLGQLPDVVQQLLHYNFVWSLIWWGFGALLLLGGLAWGLGFLRAAVKHDDGDYASVALVGVAPIVVGFIFLLENFDWLKIWLAPKLYLLDYVKTFVK